MTSHNSADQLRRFMIEDADIRGEVVTLEASLQELSEHQQLPQVVHSLLGQFAAAVTLLSSTLKFDGVMTIQARGDGPLPIIMAECSHHKQLRALAKPSEQAVEDDWRTDDIRQLVGVKGVLTLTIDPDKGERYQGIVPLDAASLAECIEHYFAQSEQLLTRVWLASSEEMAAGLMLQALPSQEITDPVTNQEVWHTQVQLANTVTSQELLLLEHPTLLKRLFHEQGVRIFDPQSVAFACSCSKVRSGEVLRQITREELDEVIKEKGFVDMTCHFCEHRYEFSPQEIEALFVSVTRH